MIDSHCHLAASEFDVDREEVLKRAKEAGIEQMISIADTLEEAKKSIALAEQYPHIYATVGVHPHHAAQWNDGDEDVIRTLAASDQVKAIGEIGLDYHYDNSPRDTQKAVFRTQLELANELNLPVVVHCREAVEDTWSIVDEFKLKQLVLHCCCEKFADVQPFLDRGYFLSFTGIVTYSSAEEIRNTVKHCPLEQLMIETDAPYLAPVPHRGKRNEPAFVAEVAQCVADVKGIDVAEVERVTTQNTIQFFNL